MRKPALPPVAELDTDLSWNGLRSVVHQFIIAGLHDLIEYASDCFRCEVGKRGLQND